MLTSKSVKQIYIQKHPKPPPVSQTPATGQLPATTGYVNGVSKELKVSADCADASAGAGTIPVASFGVVD